MGKEIEGIERIAFAEGDRKIIRAGTEHRVIYEKEQSIMEISNNGHAGFRKFSIDVTYFCFSLPMVYKSPVPERELA